MLFNSFEYALFLPLVFIIYWALNRTDLRWQNLFILIVSYIFYGFWDWRFLTLIFFSSCVDFLMGKSIYNESSEGRKKLYLLISLFVNLGLLVVFKYFNFFADSLVDLVGLFGGELGYVTLNIILPVGISFYTFQTLSYTIDIYRDQLEPTKDVISFFAFVSFFPQLVAGPVERASSLLPQFQIKRKFSQSLAMDGVRQIFWGLFKKVVVADNCAVFVNLIFADHTSQSGLMLILGAVLFAFQVYCDFSGYSDIAIGSAKLLGFKLMTNFKTPYFSLNFGEFWKRWHISLSTWIMDYVYNPLVIKWRHWTIKGIVLSSIVTFTLMGLWHGPAWHYVVFGTVLGIYLSFEAYSKKWRKRVRKKSNPLLYTWASRIVTFFLWCIACVLFRASDVEQALSYYTLTFTNNFIPENLNTLFNLKYCGLFIVVLLFFDWIFKDEEHTFRVDKFRKPFARYLSYSTVFMMLMIFAGKQQEFIYFQF